MDSRRTCLAVAAAVAAAAVALSRPAPPPPDDAATPAAAARLDGAWAAADGLAAATSRIGGGALRSAETVFFHPAACTPYTADAGGGLWRLPPPPPPPPPAAKGGGGGPTAHADRPPAPVRVGVVGGSPLGAAFSADGATLYVADASRGLLRLPVDAATGEPTAGGAGVEVLAAAAPLPGGGPPAAAAATTAAAPPRPVAYANAVAVCPVSGTVYFTDSSVVAPPPLPGGHGGADGDAGGAVDTFEASVRDALSGVPTGRLLAVDPAGPPGAVTAVTPHAFHFANGVAVAPDGRSVVVAETYGSRLVRVALPGGAVRRLGPPLPGLPDGVSRDDSARGGYWVSLFVPVPPVLRALRGAPAWARRWLAAVPRRLRPYRLPYSVIAHVTEAGEVDGVLGDPRRALGLVSSVARCVPPGGGATPLYLGVLHGDFVGRVDGAGGDVPTAVSASQ